MNLNFAGKNVLITGGSCGIALALAPLLISEDLFPILTFRNSKGEKKIKESLSGWKGRYDTTFLDFGLPGKMGDIFSKRTDINYMVDLAQGDYETLLASANPDTLSQYMAENIAARAQLVRLVSRSMVRKRFGRMIFVSSVAAGMPGKGQGLYASSKLAAEGIYRNVGLELATRGITTISLRPGYVESGRGDKFIGKNRPALLKKIPGGCFISEATLAKTLVFFLSDTGIAFNGVNLTMDGGMSCGK